MAELGWVEDDVHEQARLRREWMETACWLERCGGADDEVTAGWMRAVAAGSPINVTIYRRIQAALARWKAFRLGKAYRPDAREAPTFSG